MEADRTFGGTAIPKGSKVLHCIGLNVVGNEREAGAPLPTATFGIFHTQDKFMDEAHKLRHPYQSTPPT